MTSKEKGPVQLAIESKVSQPNSKRTAFSKINLQLTEELNPSTLEAVNESHLHAHHAAMKGNTSKETHFRVTIVSEEFAGKTMMQRHRMVYKILGEELNQGLHALSLKTKTQAELAKSS
ncbi:hypothetical protein EC973_008750 [Apophysomyces ossiformis]|uniref:Bola-like protein n=1 Tax=Apophysomyces ossiformis TaxID=679940 RepID=A0A8H7ENV0_9FUNG|nr:hypothetical protein EC973_008750 [Apophysomyces ossiformis]